MPLKQTHINMGEKAPCKYSYFSTLLKDILNESRTKKNTSVVQHVKIKIKEIFGASLLE